MVKTRSQTEQDRLLLRPLDDEDFVWPTINTLLDAQRKFGATVEKATYEVSEDRVRRHDKKTWIPVAATDLHRRLYNSVHCGPQGHRGGHTMVTRLGKNIHIPQLRKTADKFLKSCLLCHHCLAPGAKSIDAIGVIKQCTGVFFILANPLVTCSMYWYSKLMCYCELVKSEAPTCTAAADTIMNWRSRYGIPRVWITDQGTHFKKEVIILGYPASNEGPNPGIQTQLQRLAQIDINCASKSQRHCDTITDGEDTYRAVHWFGTTVPFAGSIYMGPEVTNRVQPIRTSEEIEQNSAQQHLSVKDMRRAVEDARLKQMLLNKKK
ncbi:Hypothetical protein PHPALM_6447 [Phytophthora palmivora]|uniref:Integrase catalytic domain-containing protein n=1 Tax=Phytophthora palmivora TaxID=4796 RepID=A0A2P4YF44_9STRA|nr:Hypothetical protein PHPALM_6447 [Phytophthora palmivora]